MTAALRHRPIYGGVFGRGRYALATMPYVENGLHAVKYLVIDPATGAVLSVAKGKRDALAFARDVLEGSAAYQRQLGQGAGLPIEQGWLWPVETLPPSRPSTPRRPISKRRRVIFEKSGGRCHYCAAVLTLDGRWHVEHMLPRALGGEDDPSNLVAACGPCNLAKRDRTALEFVSMGSEDR